MPGVVKLPTLSKSLEEQYAELKQLRAAVQLASVKKQKNEARSGRGAVKA